MCDIFSENKLGSCRLSISFAVLLLLKTYDRGERWCGSLRYVVYVGEMSVRRRSKVKENKYDYECCCKLRMIVIKYFFWIESDVYHRMVPLRR